MELKFDSVVTSKNNLASTARLACSTQATFNSMIFKTILTDIGGGLWGNIIKGVVKCASAYGMVFVLASFIFFYATIRFVLPYIYKIVCKICNTLVKYKDVHAKANVKDVSFETELHR